MHAVLLSDGHCQTDKIFLSFWQRLHQTGDSYAYRATSSRIKHNSMLELVLSSIPTENFVAIQHCENKFKNGTFLIKNEFLRSRKCTARFFRENNDKMSHFLSPANTENS